MNTCTRPNKAFVLGKKENGKNDIIFCTYAVDHIEIHDHDRVVKAYSTFIQPGCLKIIKEYIEIPCGKCLSCKLNHAKQWADRCMLESKYHNSNYFITLTYNNENCPVSEYIDENGELHYCQTLKKEDFQKFMKRLRKKLDYNNLPNVKYLACGEYGSQTKRPHYHAIIFGLELNDLVQYSRTKKGSILYTSKFLEEVWPYGFVSVGEANQDSMGYVARYTTKKINCADSCIYDKLNIEKEFLLSSKKPAIGLRGLEDNLDNFIDYGKIYISTIDGSVQIYSNKYFNSKLENLDPDYLEKKEERKLIAKEREDIVLSNTSLKKIDYLKVVEENLKERTYSLSRKEI